MTDEMKGEHAGLLTDDSLNYAQAQQAGEQPDDPLAAIKELRLRQLAVCRLKSEERCRRCAMSWRVMLLIVVSPSGEDARLSLGW